jgi:hypothetical protein
MNNLARCPFCGSEELEIRGSSHTKWIACLSCRADGPTANGNTPELAKLAAAEAWNYDGCRE